MRNQKGFTIIEMLMVILLVAILSAVAVPQFLDFRKEAKTAAVAAGLGAMRSGISNQKGQLALRCNKNTYPVLTSVTGNDVVASGDCTGTQVPSPQEKIVSSGIPDNAWSALPTSAKTIVACTGAGCNRVPNSPTSCDGSAITAANNGWCYNPANGEFWANTNTDNEGNL